MPIIRIGTRDSQLAMWQAKQVQQKLKAIGYSTQLVPLKSKGDLELTQPLYRLGVTGIFTKVLDSALLDNTIDLAVHSLKDVPTQLPIDIEYAAFLPRSDHRDVLIYKTDKNPTENLTNQLTIATGSLRRKSFWLHKFPHHHLVDLRGNINLRLQKLLNNPWDGAIFASAGLKRIALLDELQHQGLQYCFLDWMINAPAQGIIGLTCLAQRTDIRNICKAINNTASEIEAYVERDFLSTLEGGCTAPIGAKAHINSGKINLHTALLSLDGSLLHKLSLTDSIENYTSLGKRAAALCLAHGGREIMASIRRSLD